MTKQRWWRALLSMMLTLSALFGAGVASAQDATEKPADPWEIAKAAAKEGPQDIPLANQAVLKLPAGRVFIPQPQATMLLNAMGNPGEEPDLLGLIFPVDDEAEWFITLNYESSGYIKDDDAKDWDAEELLQSYKDGTEAANEERRKQGVSELEILGWAEKPVYDAATHRLVWAMKSRDKGEPDDADLGVNYNTYVLGREGYFTMNLVTGLSALEADKPAAHAMLGALEFKDGKRYADFNPSTDHMAEYGLAALVVGVGAKKLGLLAVIAAFAAKFAKVGLLALAGLGYGIKRWFSGRKDKS